MAKPKKKPIENFEDFQRNADRFELVDFVPPGVSADMEDEDEDEDEDETEVVEDETTEPQEALVEVESDPAAGKAWRFELSEPGITDLLQRGEFGGLKLVPWGSNYTFVAPLHDPKEDQDFAVIYKPMRGEAPLWDFPSGTLYKREYGAYLVARALGWHFIPPVVIREGPHGVGTVQIFVDVDERIEFYQYRESHAHELKRMVIFDYITNNADRKAGHCLMGVNGHIWAIDHGLCFNHVPKLRTVMWDWAGQPLPDDICRDLAEFAMDSARIGDLRAQLLELLERREVQLLMSRLQEVIANPQFPELTSRRQIPWGWF